MCLTHKNTGGCKIEKIMKTLRTILLILGLLFSPCLAEANIGVPMIFITIPGMLIALFPVILIESLVIAKQLAISFKSSIKAAALGNVISTIVGIPITWVILVAIQIGTGGDSSYGINSPLKKFLAVTWQAPWLIPYEEELYWMIPAATLFLIVPFFFASWWIEYRVERKFINDIESARINRAVRNANLASYGMLALIVLGFLLTAKPEIR